MDFFISKSFHQRAGDFLFPNPSTYGRGIFYFQILPPTGGGFFISNFFHQRTEDFLFPISSTDGRRIFYFQFLPPAGGGFLFPISSTSGRRIFYFQILPPTDRGFLFPIPSTYGQRIFFVTPPLSGGFLNLLPPLWVGGFLIFCCARGRVSASKKKSI